MSTGKLVSQPISGICERCNKPISYARYDRQFFADEAPINRVFEKGLEPDKCPLTGTPEAKECPHIPH